MARPFGVALRLFSCAILTSCASGPTQVLTYESFNPSLAEYVMDEGPYTVSGQAFMRTVGGDVKTCAGGIVQLVPATAYAAERMRAIYGSDIAGWISWTQRGKKLPAADSEYLHYIRTTQCDVSGRFSFPKTAAGTYFVIAPVSWSTGQPYVPLQGGSQMRKVDAGEQSENLILAP